MSIVSEASRFAAATELSERFGAPPGAETDAPTSTADVEPSGDLSAPTPAPEAPAGTAVDELHSRFVHVVEQGTCVRRQGARLCVTKGDKVLLDVPALKLQGVVLYGNVHVTTPCLRSLLQEGVWLAICSRNGTYRGRLEGPQPRGGVSRRVQWQRSQDAEFCLRWSKAIVLAKIRGQRELAAAYASNYLADTLGEGHLVLREAIERVAAAKDLDELRGIEGYASRAYFGLFRRWNRSELVFDGRSKHPATDPVNAMLNLGYTLVTRELDGLLQGAGFDSTIGFYHQPDRHRASLACDWVEEFRHVVIDRLVLKLVNRGSIKAGDCGSTTTSGVRFTPAGLRTFLTAYEHVMTGHAPASDDERPVGIRGLLLMKLGRLVDTVMEDVPYDDPR